MFLLMLFLLLQDPNWKDWEPKSRPTISTRDNERTDRRKITVEGIRYVVVFDVLTREVYSAPATNPPGPAHYPADITIFRVDYKAGKNGSATTYTQIAGTFRGEWTEEGCFEDDPGWLVKETLRKLKQKK